MIKIEPLVSVIITTYKRNDMIGRAIDSVLKQTYKNIEIIVVDDNDPNTEHRKLTEEKMSQYTNNVNFKYIKHEKNKNGAAARNTGIKESSGEIVCFLDDDDWFVQDKVEKQVKYLLNNSKFNGVYCGWDRAGKVVLPKKEGDLSYELLSGTNLIYTNTIMMWKKCAINCKGWDERFKRNQEAAFLLRFFSNGYKIGVVSECLVGFDISDRSNVLDPKKNEEQFVFYLNQHKNLIDKLENESKGIKKSIYSYRYRGILLYYLKERDVLGAIKVYLKMLIRMPITFNKDIVKYIYSRIRKLELYEV